MPSREKALVLELRFEIEGQKFHMKDLIGVLQYVAPKKCLFTDTE